MIWALHGAFGSPEDWLPVADAVTAHVHWAYVDLWDDPSGTISLPEMAGKLCEAAAEIDPAPILAGYSLGGRIALHMLAAWPQLFHAAIIISAHPGLPTDAERAARRDEDARWLERLETLAWPEFWDAWNGRGALTTSPPFQNAPTFRPAMRRALAEWSLGQQANLRPDLAKVRSPVLWLTGVRDEKFSALATAVAPHMPRARHEIVEDCGHRLLKENSAAVARALDAVLQNGIFDNS